VKIDPRTLSALALGVAVCGLCPASGAVRFYALGDLPGGLFESHATGVSADGSVVVGTSRSAASTFEAFRWTKSGGIGPLGGLPGGIIVTGAQAVSASGNVVAAAIGAEAVRWSVGGKLDMLGDLPGGTVSSYASAISADGTVVGGAGWSSNGVEPFRWTAATGMVGLGGIGAAPVNSYPQGISPDGSVLVGGAQITGGFEAFTADGVFTTQALGHLTMTNKSAYANAISANGVVVGFDGGPTGTEAYRWATGLGMVGIGDLPGGTTNSSAEAVSANASVIVGSGNSAVGEEAVRWDAGLPPVTIRAWLADRGLVPAGWILRRCETISANGRHIAGEGVNPDGSTEAWLVSELLAPPTIALTGKPKVRARKNGRFKVPGIATDDAAVVRVEYQLGGKGAWMTASGTSGWLVTAKLKKSTKKTTVLIRSVDEDGQTSLTVSAKVTR
jgi:probable HAF family extracellular repeat protein